jgi:hypothetical protein
VRNIFGSWLSRKAKVPGGWCFTFQGNLDLKRQVAYVHVSDEGLAEKTALDLLPSAGVVIDRRALSLSELGELDLAPGEHLLSEGDFGWSFHIQPTAQEARLVMVYLPDEARAERKALAHLPGAVLQRSKVPSSVLADMKLSLGGVMTV